MLGLPFLVELLLGFVGSLSKISLCLLLLVDLGLGFLPFLISGGRGELFTKSVQGILSTIEVLPHLVDLVLFVLHGSLELLFFDLLLSDPEFVLVALVGLSLEGSLFSKLGVHPGNDSLEDSIVVGALGESLKLLLVLLNDLGDSGDVKSSVVSFILKVTEISLLLKGVSGLLKLLLLLIEGLISLIEIVHVFLEFGHLVFELLNLLWILLSAQRTRKGVLFRVHVIELRGQGVHFKIAFIKSFLDGVGIFLNHSSLGVESGVECISFLCNLGTPFLFLFSESSCDLLGSNFS